MEAEFWLNRWVDGQIGWHREAVNPLLQNHWTGVGAAGGRVLVPLCGKSVDMIWLSEQGHKVIGVELSSKAAKDFFEESGISFVVKVDAEYEIYSSNGIEIWCGDFFHIDRKLFPSCEFFYDRAAVVAIEKSALAMYQKKLSELLAPKARGLVIGLDYEQSQMDGPPFSVPEKELKQISRSLFELEMLESTDLLQSSPRYSERGLTRMAENVYISRKVDIT